MTLLSFAGFLAQTPSTGSGGGSMLTIGAALLFFAAITLFVIEMLVPSGGILGLGAVICAIGGIVCLFWIDTTYGLVGMAATLLAAPFFVGFAMYLLPYTPLFRRMMLEDDEPTGDEEPQRRFPEPKADPLVGAEGEALTLLKPIGTCRINGRRESCISVTTTIEKGTRVRVVGTDGMTLQVQPIESAE